MEIGHQPLHCIYFIPMPARHAKLIESRRKKKQQNNSIDSSGNEQVDLFDASAEQPINFTLFHFVSLRLCFFFLD